MWDDGDGDGDGNGDGDGDGGGMGGMGMARRPKMRPDWLPRWRPGGAGTWVSGSLGAASPAGGTPKERPEADPQRNQKHLISAPPIFGSFGAQSGPKTGPQKMTKTGAEIVIF